MTDLVTRESALEALNYVEQSNSSGRKQYAQDKILEKAKHTDTERLNYMIQHEAYMTYTKDGEKCRVFTQEYGDDPVPVCGWRNFFDDPRKAIDAAMALNRVG